MTTDADPRQVAVIPIRRPDGGAAEVCLIRRNTSKKWGIPKGYIEQQDWEDAALIEVYEEAGLNGSLVGGIVGTYEYDKPPVLTVAVYVMEVTEALTAWPEMRWRERGWFSIEEAGERLRDHPMSGLYTQVCRQLATILR